MFDMFVSASCFQFLRALWFQAVYYSLLVLLLTLVFKYFRFKLSFCYIIWRRKKLFWWSWWGVARFRVGIKKSEISIDNFRKDSEEISKFRLNNLLLYFPQNYCQIFILKTREISMIFQYRCLISLMFWKSWKAAGVW